MLFFGIHDRRKCPTGKIVQCSLKRLPTDAAQGQRLSCLLAKKKEEERSGTQDELSKLRCPKYHFGQKKIISYPKGIGKIFEEGNSA